MFEEIKELADKRLKKITEQLILLDQVEDFPRFVYTEFKDVMKEPYSYIVNLVNSREDRLNNHDIQQWFMNLANKYLQKWLHDNHPEYENKVFVSNHNKGTFPSRFRIWYQVSEYNDIYDTGQKEICRFDVYEQTYMNALHYKTIDKYDKSVENELVYLNKNLNESKENLDKWLAYQDKPITLIKGIRDAFVYIKDKKEIINNINTLVTRYRNNYKDAEEKFIEFNIKSPTYRDNYLKCYDVIKVIDEFFYELSYKLIENNNYY